MKIRKKQKINHGRKNKRKQKICHGNKNKQRQRQKHLPRINTEKHGRKAKQKNLPRINTERSHCIQSRKRARRYKYTIWKGPFRQVQSPGNLCGMSAFALKGQNEIAQGNALGKWPNKTPSPERAKGFGR